MNFLWKAPKSATIFLMRSSDGRIVVRRWNVPSCCPNPDPGTVRMPVSSTSLRQYHVSGLFPAASAAARALFGRWIRGNEYIAPSVGLHVTPSHAAKASATTLARSESRAMIPDRSSRYSARDSPPSGGGVTIRATAACPSVFGQRLIDEIL